MYCPKCGAENIDGDQTCQSCSGVLEWSETPATTEPPKTSRLAIASLMLGILSPFMLLIPAIPAIITGVISLVKIRKSEGKLKGRGLAVIGTAVSIILLALFLPTIFAVSAFAERLICTGNMKGLVNVMNAYAFDYDDKYPTGSKWCDLLITEADTSMKYFVCPGDDQGQCNYALNVNALRLGKDAPSDMVLMFECASGWNQVGGSELLTIENHDGEGCNIMHVDGFVGFVKTQDLNRLRWTLDEFDEPQYDF